MNTKSYEFESEIIEMPRGGAGVEFPYDVKTEFHTGGQVKIKAWFEDVEYRGSLAPMGHGCHLLGIKKEIRLTLGKNIGDKVHVKVILDTQPRIVEVPKDLEVLFKSNSQARQAFDILPYTHKKEYVEYIESALKPETRISHIQKVIDKLIEK